MHVGDPASGPVHLGSLIDEVQRNRVHTLVQDAVAQGAELRAGGTDEANSPFGGIASSGTGGRLGGPQANIEAFTETRWITLRREPGQYPL